jgi:hypothetical protein
MLSAKDLIKNAQKNRNRSVSRMIDLIFEMSVELYTNHNRAVVINNLKKVVNGSFMIEA